MLVQVGHVGLRPGSPFGDVGDSALGDRLADLVARTCVRQPQLSERSGNTRVAQCILGELGGPLVGCPQLPRGGLALPERFHVQCQLGFQRERLVRDALALVRHELRRPQLLVKVVAGVNAVEHGTVPRLEQPGQSLLVGIGEHACPLHRVEHVGGQHANRHHAIVPLVQSAMQNPERLLRERNQFSLVWVERLALLLEIAGLLEGEHVERAVVLDQSDHMPHLELAHHRVEHRRVDAHTIAESVLLQRTARHPTHGPCDVDLPAGTHVLALLESELLRGRDGRLRLLVRLEGRRLCPLHYTTWGELPRCGQRNESPVTITSHTLEEDAVRHPERLVVRVEEVERDLQGALPEPALRLDLGDRLAKSIQREYLVLRVQHLASLERVGSPLDGVDSALVLRGHSVHDERDATDEPAIQQLHVGCLNCTARPSDLRVAPRAKQIHCTDGHLGQQCLIRLLVVADRGEVLSNRHLRNHAACLDPDLRSGGVDPLLHLDHVRGDRLRHHVRLGRRHQLGQRADRALCGYLLRTAVQPLAQLVRGLDDRVVSVEQIIQQELVVHIEVAHVVVFERLRQQQRLAGQSHQRVLLEAVCDDQSARLGPFLLGQPRQAVPRDVTRVEQLVDRHVPVRLGLQRPVLLGIRCHTGALDERLLVPGGRLALLDPVRADHPLHVVRVEHGFQLGRLLESFRDFIIRQRLPRLDRAQLDQRDVDELTFILGQRKVATRAIVPQGCTNSFTNVVESGGRHHRDLAGPPVRVVHVELDVVGDLRQRGKLPQQLGHLHPGGTRVMVGLLNRLYRDVLRGRLRHREHRGVLKQLVLGNHPVKHS